ncbi:hypothetical protein [Streptomyces sp. NPDC002676]
MGIDMAEDLLSRPEASRESDRAERRKGERRQAAGAGRKPKLAFMTGCCSP